ncbi:MAG: acyl-CoA thioesterase [Deltaproteobacteria bacterium]|jgi:acyl-CoA thioester hydrolase|nr:acyl-CoA thioesterase [Deltaproteobacteria bacterium]
MNTFPTHDLWHTHRVSYGETDAMGMVYYANYLHLFERVRSEFIRAQGMSYAKVEEQGIYLPVREAVCRYRSPLRYDDLIWLRIGISEWGHASVTFAYEIRSEDKSKLHATGKTQHAFIDRTLRPVPVPDWFREIFK